MTDYIDRQAAIDAVNDVFVNHLPTLLPRYEDMPLECASAIMRLPSAHPGTDEWCTDCKEYDQEKHNCPRFNRVIRETLEEVMHTEEGEDE